MWWVWKDIELMIATVCVAGVSEGLTIARTEYEVENDSEALQTGKDQNF